MDKYTEKMENFKNDLKEMRLPDFVVAFEIMQEEIKERYLLKALESDPIVLKRAEDAALL